MDKNYCVLIDSENVSKKMTEIFNEISKYGASPIRKIFGDFFDKSNNWKSVCEEFAITPVQTYNFTKGKNSIDIALVIEGMELLYSKQYLDGIVIVASDSDYTSLARKWRNECKEVIVIGKKTTPKSLQNSCTTFINSEVLLTDEEAIKEKSNNIDKVSSELKALIKDILNSHSGVLQISSLVDAIMKVQPSFDVRNYGYKKAPEFFKGEFKKTLDIRLVKENVYEASLKSVNKEEINKKIIEIVSSNKDKAMNIGELNKKIKEKGIDLSQLGYSRVKKYLESISSLDIKDNNVYIKESKKS